jgi:hypothetical protein
MILLLTPLTQASSKYGTGSDWFVIFLTIPSYLWSIALKIGHSLTRNVRPRSINDYHEKPRS